MLFCCCSSLAPGASHAGTRAPTLPAPPAAHGVDLLLDWPSPNLHPARPEKSCRWRPLCTARENCIRKLELMNVIIDANEFWQIKICWVSTELRAVQENSQTSSVFDQVVPSLCWHRDPVKKARFINHGRGGSPPKPVRNYLCLAILWLLKKKPKKLDVQNTAVLLQ